MASSILYQVKVTIVHVPENYTSEQRCWESCVQYENYTTLIYKKDKELKITEETQQNCKQDVIMFPNKERGRNILCQMMFQHSSTDCIEKDLYGFRLNYLLSFTSATET